MTMAWRPFTDKWNNYSEYLTELTEQGLLFPGQQDRMFPADLNIGEEEQEDIEEFINDRISELYGHIFPSQGANPSVISAYLMRSIIAAMLWEKERIGK